MENLTDETVQQVGEFIKKYPLQTRDYTFGEVALILLERHAAELEKPTGDTVNHIFGTYGKGSKIDNKERTKTY